MSSASNHGVLNRTSPSPIVLTTLNARYIHASFGLRYLKANLGSLSNRCVISEFTLESRPEDVVETLLSYQPKVVGLGVYIWNTTQTEKVVRLLKTVAPDVIVVLGGPEVSYEYQDQSIVAVSDYVITGWGEVSFRKLMLALLSDIATPSEKIINGEQPKLDKIVMPYHLYTDNDIKNRVLYVEASRGCPFKCEFCLSALDKTAWPFDLPTFLKEMDTLYQRGARHFKFVDRTFNLKVSNSLQILDFFLARMSPDLFLHFEVIPDHLPPALKEKIQQFPTASLQFEIGIQSFNPQVQQRISRRQNNDTSKANLQWLRANTHAHIHADLIFGLPSESLESFADSFNTLYQLKPHEIQVGILKRLKGSTLIRHTEQHKLAFNPNPPFNIVASDTVDYPLVQRINRFARYWDLLANSGHFKQSLKILLGEDAFSDFLTLSDALFQRSGQTHKISLLRLYDLVFSAGTQELQIAQPALINAIAIDFSESGLKSIPQCLQQQKQSKQQQKNQRNRRQTRH